eukprot:ANDGO_05408.mRNA.1 Thymidine kinase
MSDHEGHIQLIIGPMFAGKSTELMRRIRRYNVAKKRCVLIKFKADTRYSAECMATHDRQTIAAKGALTLAEVETDVEHVDVIGIDEGQFFPDLVPFCEKHANAGRTIIISALDATFQRKAFPNVAELIPMAESVEKLTAVCMKCSRAASFSKRISAECEVNIIGGADKYVSVCRACYFEPQVVPSTNKENASDHETARPNRPQMRMSSHFGNLVPIRL